MPVAEFRVNDGCIAMVQSGLNFEVKIKAAAAKFRNSRIFRVIKFGLRKSNFHLKTKPILWAEWVLLAAKGEVNVVVVASCFIQF